MYSSFLLIAQRKQSPNGRKWAQSGHPDLAPSASASRQMQVDQIWQNFASWVIVYFG
jgi:hypothetical protein